MIEASTTQPTTTASTHSAYETPLQTTKVLATRVMNTSCTTKTESTGLMGRISNRGNPPQACTPRNVYEMIEGVTGLVSRAIELITTYLKMREKEDEKPATKPPSSNPSGAPSTPLVEPEEEEQSADCRCVCSPTSLPTPTEEPSAEVSLTKRKLGSSLKGSGEFLWKPISDKDGKLAVLLPKSLTDSVSEVAIVSADKKRVLQRGRFSGVGNGDRTHFRFSKPGGEFPDGSIVWIKLKNGGARHVVIKDTAARLTR